MSQLSYFAADNGTWQNIDLRFTDVTMNPNISFMYMYGCAPVNLTLRDCQLHGGNFTVYAGEGYDYLVYGRTVGFTNNLFDRCTVYGYRPYSTGQGLNFYNNLFHGGTFNLYYYVYEDDSGVAWQVVNDLFDHTMGSETGGSENDENYGLDWEWEVNNSHDAWLNVSGYIALWGGSGNKVLGQMDFQNGPLGRYYYPTTGTNLGSLTNAGTGNANSYGLYHYTTQTNQLKETNSTVDIGFHYVAVGANGQPLDYNSNNIPDYAEDANGNGTHDGGDLGDWTNFDNDADGLPDWWELKYFGSLAQTASGNYDDDGLNNGAEYANGTDPNKIQFQLVMTNNYVSTSTPGVQVAVQAGVPSQLAVLVDNTNLAGAAWGAYSSSNLTVSLGSTQGWHRVWIGLRGLPADAFQTWQSNRIKLDTTPPWLVVTNPVSTNVAVPMIQLQGYCAEALAGVTYDVSNTLGVITNQAGGITDQHYDTNTWEFTTNYFECLDVPLAVGTNRITLHAADLAGNLTTTNFNFIVNYATKTNPPAVTMIWPTNNAKVCGDSFACRGYVNDPTVTLTAQITDTGGDTNAADGLVERDGRFWVEGLPLNSGTNTLTLTFTDAAGNVTVTNLSIIKSSLTLTINPVTVDDSQRLSQNWRMILNETRR